LIFLIVTRAVSALGLSRREAWWKDAEILMLRHQLAVALRERPRAHSRLTWPDRAWLALLAGTLPADRLAMMRLIEPGSSSKPGTCSWTWRTPGHERNSSYMTGTPASRSHQGRQQESPLRQPGCAVDITARIERRQFCRVSAARLP